MRTHIYKYSGMRTHIVVWGHIYTPGCWAWQQGARHIYSSMRTHIYTYTVVWGHIYSSMRTHIHTWVLGLTARRPSRVRTPFSPTNRSSIGNGCEVLPGASDGWVIYLLLTYADVCLTYADVCWRILTNTGRVRGCTRCLRGWEIYFRKLNSWLTN